MTPALSPSLYAVLGILADATPAQIKAGYREAAKSAHPDKGGTADTFAHVQLAYDILSNPERRAKYDATGDQSEAQPDNETAELVGLIMDAFNRAAEQAANALDRVDIIDMAARLLAANAQVGQDTNTGMRAARKRLENAAARLKFKGNGPDYIGNAIAAQMADIDRNIAKNEAAIARIKKAAKMLRKGWKYKTDAPSATSATTSGAWTFA